jgi:hypothetical protein
MSLIVVGAYQVIVPAAGMPTAVSAAADTSAQLPDRQGSDAEAMMPEGSCCATFHLQGGRNDNFSLTGAAEPTTPTPGSAAARFDETAPNHALTHRFTLPSVGCICAASLEMRLKPIRDISPNDTFGLTSGTGAAWSRHIGTGNPDSPLGLPGITSPWGGSNFTSHVVTLDLANLGAGRTGSIPNLLNAMSTSHVLDMAIQDDTSVDYARLTYSLMECPGGREDASDEDPRATRS